MLLIVENMVDYFQTAEYQIQECLIVFSRNCMRLMSRGHISSDRANEQNANEVIYIIQFVEPSPSKNIRKMSTRISQ